MKLFQGYEVEPTKLVVTDVIPAFAGDFEDALVVADGRRTKGKPVEHFGVMVPADQKSIIPIEKPHRTKTVAAVEGPRKFRKKPAPPAALTPFGLCRDYYRAIKATRSEFVVPIPSNYPSNDRFEAAKLLDDLLESGCFNEEALKALVAWHIRQKLSPPKTLDYNVSVRSLRESWSRFKPMAPRGTRSDDSGAKALKMPIFSQEETGGIGGDIDQLVKKPNGMISALAAYGVICVGHQLLKTKEKGEVLTLLTSVVSGLPDASVRAIYRRSTEYDLPIGASHPLAGWRELLSEQWSRAKCVDPDRVGAQFSVTMAFVEPVV